MDSDYRVFSKMLRTLAQGCGSSAWVCAVHGEHSWVVGQFPESAQHEVWDSDPYAVASASVAPNGTAEAVAGGYRLSGRWGFASGCDHAQWILLGSIAKGSGAPESRMFLLPMSRGRDRRRLARDGSVRHRQQVDRRQGRDGAGQPFDPDA